MCSAPFCWARGTRSVWGFAAALIRNVLGLGSLLAFPGSMIGALLCGLAYKACPKLPVAYVGEVFGTGILGGLASYPIAAFVMGNTKAALFTFVPSFLVSTRWVRRFRFWC